MVRIRSVVPLEGHVVRPGFTDGSEKTLDLSPCLNGPIFEPLKGAPLLFRDVQVDEQLGTIVWPNGADIDPDVLYWGRTPAAWEQVEASPGVGC